ncbi:hypothetical protein E2I00_011116, partial [Balaenoptera physalus]
ICAVGWLVVQVQCTNFWFYARTKPIVSYHPHDCGVITRTVQETLLLESKSKCVSGNSNHIAEILPPSFK